ncbi:MAG TPA: S8 family serine peptidase, partial [Flavobacteriales bacterium]|nr:S8 family serine peptidase [Flavobacteriales bacterium]
MLRTILLLLSIAYTLQSFAQQAWRPGEVLVRLGREASIADVRNELAKRLPADVVQKEAQPLGARSRYHKLILQGAGTDDRELARIVAGVPGVEAVSLNYLVQRRAQPNDPQYGAQWHLAAMNVEPTWSITTGGSTADGKRIAVGIIDTGVQGSHPDLEDNIAVDVFGSEEHGTQVAGVVGAVGNNGTGISGVNWDVDLVSTASGNDLGDVISQFEFCLDQRTIFNQSNGSQGRMIVAVTVSWGVPGADCGFGEPLFEALGAAGILMVTSGPNDPTDIDVVDDYPATCPHDNNIVVTSYGPQNEVPFAVGDNTVHLLAPGLDILTTDLGNGYVSIDGNSFAIPAVAGAVALLYS